MTKSFAKAATAITVFVMSWQCVAANDEGNAFGNPQIFDIRYTTACGPIACFSALHSLGMRVSLEEMVQKCNWKKGEFVSILAMRQAINGVGGVTCVSAKLSPSELKSVMRDASCCVILATRKTENSTVDHALTVIKSGDTSFEVVDYPRLRHSITDDELANLWDGQALVVTANSPPGALAQLAGLSTALTLLTLSWVTLFRSRS